VYRAKFIINYFCHNGIDIFAPGSSWNNKMDELYETASKIFTNKGSEIINNNIISLDSNNIDTVSYDDLSDIDEEDYE